MYLTLKDFIKTLVVRTVIRFLAMKLYYNELIIKLIYRNNRKRYNKKVRSPARASALCEILQNCSYGCCGKYHTPSTYTLLGGVINILGKRPNICKAE